MDKVIKFVDHIIGYLFKCNRMYGTKIVVQQMSSVVQITENELRSLILNNLKRLPAEMHIEYLNRLTSYIDDITLGTEFIYVKEATFDDVHENEMERIMEDPNIVFTNAMHDKYFVKVKSISSAPNFVEIETEIQVLKTPRLKESDKFEYQIPDILTLYKEKENAKESEWFDKLFDLEEMTINKSIIYTDKTFDELTKEINDSDVEFCKMLNIKPSEKTALEMASEIVKIILGGKGRRHNIEMNIEFYTKLKHVADFIDFINDFLERTNLVLTIKDDSVNSYSVIDRKIFKQIFNHDYPNCTNEITDFLRNFLSVKGTHSSIEFNLYNEAGEEIFFGIDQEVEAITTNSSDINKFVIDVRLKKKN